jgi:hypothetical protein
MKEREKCARGWIRFFWLRSMADVCETCNKMLRLVKGV